MPGLTPELRSTDDAAVYIGLDAATKGDCGSGVAVKLTGSRLRLVAHRIWKPTPEEPLDIEQTIEEWLLDGRYGPAIEPGSVPKRS